MCAVFEVEEKMKFCEIFKNTFFMEHLWWLFLSIEKFTLGISQQKCFTKFLVILKFLMSQELESNKIVHRISHTF